LWALHVAPVVLACLLGFTLWVPGFHHHDNEQTSTHCAICLTVAAESWDLPSAAATLQLPLAADGRLILGETSTKPRPGVDHSQIPRGPPLT
jgi:hypothetical protein